MELEVLGGVLSAAIGGFVLGRAGNVIDDVIRGRRGSARAARLRMHEELLPRIRLETWPAFLNADNTETWAALQRSLAELANTAQTAGQAEREAATRLEAIWVMRKKCGTVRAHGREYSEANEDTDSEYYVAAGCIEHELSCELRSLEWSLKCRLSGMRGQLYYRKVRKLSPIQRVWI